jgi:hypothetical protein
MPRGYWRVREIVSDMGEMRIYDRPLEIGDVLADVGDEEIIGYPHHRGSYLIRIRSGLLGVTAPNPVWYTPSAALEAVQTWECPALQGDDRTLWVGRVVEVVGGPYEGSSRDYQNGERFRVASQIGSTGGSFILEGLSGAWSGRWFQVADGPLIRIPAGAAFRRVLDRAVGRMRVRRLLEPARLGSPHRPPRHRTWEVYRWLDRRGVSGVPDVSPGAVWRAVMLRAARQAHTRDDSEALRGYLTRRVGAEFCRRCYREAGDSTCHCWTCSGCDRTYEEGGSRCTCCGFCSSCCECYHCSSCDERYTEGCDHCETCSGCCTCNSRPDRERQTSKFHGERTDRYPRYLGVEIECGAKRQAFSALNAALVRWDAASGDDGSVNCTRAMEIATAPARGRSFERQIEEICEALEETRGYVDSSCGLHVHVDVRDLNAKQLLTLVRLYSKVEPALYSIVAPSRRGGQYSQAWGAEFETGEVFERGTVQERADRLDAVLYGSVERAKEIKVRPHKHSCRYRGLNLNALLLYGTVEFRLHHGTVNASKIKMWAAVCSKLVEYAATHSERQIARLSGSAVNTLLGVLAGDTEVVSWVKARRAHFANMERKRKGLPAIQNAPPVEPREDSEIS